MGRPRKKAHELTTKEALKRLFPKPVINRAKEEADEARNHADKKDSK
jgi:hypothetical protein